MKKFDHYSGEGFNKPSLKDRRVKVNYIIASYVDKLGHEYRKKFEFPKTYSYDQMMKKVPKTIQ